MPSSYQPNIPTGTVNLDVDYQNIQGNFQQLDTSFDVDHVTFSDQTTQNGYHKSIHLNPMSPPAAVPGYGQLFSNQVNDGVATDQALFWKTGGNRLIRLTGNFVPTASQNGASMLPGGMIIQWGFTSINASQNKSVALTLAFPNNFFSAVTTNVSLTGNSTVISVGTAPGAGSFSNLNFINNTSSPRSFCWVAIGN